MRALSSLKPIRSSAANFPHPLLELLRNTDPETLMFDYGRDYPGDGSFDWWSDACILLCRFMREAHAGACS